jgi:chromosomal replication initiation ATPase DnaA
MTKWHSKQSASQLFRRAWSRDISKQARQRALHSALQKGLPASLLADYTLPGMPARVKAIMVDVAAKHRMPVEMFFCYTRIKPVVAARQEAMWRIRQEIPVATYPMIARWFGGTDHSTIIWGCRRHEARMQDGVAL